MNASSYLARLTLAGAALLLTQCAMPPRDAWRIVQSEGLIPYLAGNYSYQPESYQPGMAQSRYLASAAPLQHNVATAPVVPYRAETGPVSNRYLAGSYYQPEQDSASERPKPKPKSTPQRTRESASVDGPTPPPTPSTAASSDAKKIDKLLEPKDQPTTPPTKLVVDDLPYGTPVSGRPGMVNSPFATKDQLVDVTGMSVGETVKCPYSGKLFRVPPSQAAAAPKSAPPEPPAPEPEAKSDSPPADAKAKTE